MILCDFIRHLSVIIVVWENCEIVRRRFKHSANMYFGCFRCCCKSLLKISRYHIKNVEYLARLMTVHCVFRFVIFCYFLKHLAVTLFSDLFQSSWLLELWIATALEWVVVDLLCILLMENAWKLLKWSMWWMCVCRSKTDSSAGNSQSVVITIYEPRRSYDN